MKINGLKKELPPILVGTSSGLFTDEMSPWIPTDLTLKEQFAAIDQIWEMGLHAFDCAAGYGERVLGAYLLDRDRVEDAVILTKGCHPNFYLSVRRPPLLKWWVMTSSSQWGSNLPLR